MENLKFRGSFWSLMTVILPALLGKIDAAQKSSNELAQHVTALLKDGYILKPAVSISIIDQKPY